MSYDDDDDDDSLRGSNWLRSEKAVNRGKPRHVTSVISFKNRYLTSVILLTIQNKRTFNSESHYVSTNIGA